MTIVTCCNQLSTVSNRYEVFLSQRIASCLRVLSVCCLCPPAAQDSECETVIQVRRNTLYQPSCGQKLIIKCPVFYCNKSPTISWIKLENNTHPVPVPVSGSSHITAEWEQINSTAGISKLIFNKILRSDSGLYCCGSEGSQSHVINVTVKGETLSGPTLSIWLWLWCSSSSVLDPTIQSLICSSGSTVHASLCHEVSLPCSAVQENPGRRHQVQAAHLPITPPRPVTSTKTSQLRFEQLTFLILEFTSIISTMEVTAWQLKLHFSVASESISLRLSCCCGSYFHVNVAF
uniref:Ig-like domain-containing protein n=1 Tax=Echeneis naucrates TaxID=173247 RepID=A0A665WBV6_ECHNA